MKKSANSNMYEVALAQSWDRFGTHLDGSPQAVACVVSFSALSQQARAALTSSVATLGYGKAACTFLTLSVGEALAGTELFATIEGLDPLVLVIADDEAAQACSEAYQQPLTAPDKGRLLGRDVVAFKNFEAMLADDKEKQKAWRLLKRLPRLGS